MHSWFRVLRWFFAFTKKSCLSYIIFDDKLKAHEFELLEQAYYMQRKKFRKK